MAMVSRGAEGSDPTLSRHYSTDGRCSMIINFRYEREMRELEQYIRRDCYKLTSEERNWKDVEVMVRHFIEFGLALFTESAEDISQCDTGIFTALDKAFAHIPIILIPHEHRKDFRRAQRLVKKELQRRAA
jgi:hypothetical protein